MNRSGKIISRLHPLCLQICFTVVLLHSLFTSASGQQVADSLIAKLSHTSQDTDRINLLCDISDAYSIANTTLGLQYGKQALEEAKRVDWGKGIFLANNNIGNNFQNASRYDSASIYYKAALGVAEDMRNNLFIANAYNAIGMNFQAIGNMPEALRYELKALSLFEDIHKPQGAAMCYGNIAVIYYNQNDSAKAVTNYLKALDLCRKLDDRYGIAVNLTNLGQLYQEVGQPQKALPLQQEALAIADSNGLANLMFINLENIGNTYQALGDFRTSISYRLRALDRAKQFGNEDYTAVYTGELGKLYLNAATDTGNALEQLGIKKEVALRLAKQHLDTAISLLGSGNNFLNLALFYQLRSQLNELTGQSSAALDDYKKSKVYYDSVNSLEVRRQLISLETERELQLKDKQIEIDKLAIEKKRNERLYFAIGIVLLLFLIVFVVRQRRRTEDLLLNILPPEIADRLKKREHPIADAFDNASIVFIDMVNFTEFTRAHDPKLTVSTLNDIFTIFDGLTERHGLEKIKTIGDCYMAVAGLPTPQSDFAPRAANMALDAKRAMANYQTADGKRISFRIGIDCGPVVAGVIGRKKFIYDLWGESVNTASRMESTGVTGEIHCTDNFRIAAGDRYTYISRGITEVKGIGIMETWLLKDLQV